LEPSPLRLTLAQHEVEGTASATDVSTAEIILVECGTIHAGSTDLWVAGIGGGHIIHIAKLTALGLKTG
jgi:hypothetical protein